MVQEGAEVAEDDVLILVESMKMEIPIPSPDAGKIIRVLVNEGDPISEGDPVVVIETA
jgi:acetyl-CoA carboxylase biotin carboxyl carrier protein